MSTVSHYDYIIAGAGAAGLSLLWHILESSQLKKKTILLADRSFSGEENKTWCFWDKSLIPFTNLIKHSWPEIEVRSNGSVFSQKPETYQYHCIQSHDFFREMLERARSSSRVTLLETDITGFDHGQSQSILNTASGSFTAEWTFQSIKTMFRDKKPNHPSLLQHFHGHVIHSERPIFDPEHVTLMDFNTGHSSDDGTSFFYVLPFDRNRALIEYTLFSDTVLAQETYSNAITDYLNKRFELSPKEYTIEKTETGAIPMDDRPVIPNINPRTLSIGTSGGATKPTTGYTFTRIQKHCAHIVETLAKGMQPPAFPSSSFRFRLYDHLLLYILRNNPVKSPAIFHNLFQHNSMQRVLTFLDEKTTLAQESRIFLSLPYSPFLKALFRTGFNVPKS